MSFKENYTQKVLPEIAKELDIKNPMQLPMIEKVVAMLLLVTKIFLLSRMILP